MKNKTTKLGLSLILAFIVLTTFILHKIKVIDISHILNYVESNGYFGWFIFLTVYVAATLILALPETVFAIAGGFIFNYWIALILVIIGTISGALIAFILGRYLFHDYFHEKLSNTKLLQWSRLEDQNKLRWVVMLSRINPFIPFNLSNYAFGLTKITTKNYIIATTIGVIPACVLLVFIGDSFSEFVPFRWVVAVGIIIILLSLIILLKDKIQFKKAGEVDIKLKGAEVKINPKRKT